MRESSAVRLRHDERVDLAVRGNVLVAWQRWKTNVGGEVCEV